MHMPDDDKELIPTYYTPPGAAFSVAVDPPYQVPSLPDGAKWIEPGFEFEAPDLRYPEVSRHYTWEPGQTKEDKCPVFSSPAVEPSRKGEFDYFFINNSRELEDCRVHEIERIHMPEDLLPLDKLGSNWQVIAGESGLERSIQYRGPRTPKSKEPLDDEHLLSETQVVYRNDDLLRDSDPLPHALFTKKKRRSNRGNGVETSKFYLDELGKLQPAKDVTIVDVPLGTDVIAAIRDKRGLDPLEKIAPGLGKVPMQFYAALRWHPLYIPDPPHGNPEAAQRPYDPQKAPAPRQRTNGHESSRDGYETRVPGRTAGRKVCGFNES